MRYFEEDEKRVSEVSNLIDRFADERAAKEVAKATIKQARTFAIYLIKEGKENAEIVSVTHLSEEEVEKLRSEA